MNGSELPEDLAVLEARLRARAPLPSPDALRARVLGAVAREVTFERRVRLVSVAASALVALGLRAALPEATADDLRCTPVGSERELAALERVGIDCEFARRRLLTQITPLAPPLKGL